MRIGVQVLVVLFALCFVVSAKSSWDVQCYNSETCDAACYSMCDNECSGFYATGSSYCNDYGNGHVTMDCYCDLSGLGFSIVIILPTLFLCWCCVAIVSGLVICQRSFAYRFESKPLLSSELTEENYVVYTASPSYCTRLGAFCLIFFTCGLTAPFVVIKLVKKFFTRFWFAGEQGEFHGKPMDYCLNVCCVNNIIGCFTCGFWFCCGCADLRQAKWIDEHTTVVGRDSRADQNIFLFQARPAWYKVLLTSCCSMVTCGVAAPLFFVRNLKETISQMRFGKRDAQFVAETDDYVDSTWAPICCFNWLTCNLYTLCGFADARTRSYIDRNIKRTSDSSRATSANVHVHNDHDSLPSMSSIPPQYDQPLVRDSYASPPYTGSSGTSGISLEKNEAPPAYPQMRTSDNYGGYGTYQKPL